MSKINALVTIEKSFDDCKVLTKEWEAGDFREFFEKEGEYLDRLANATEEKGKYGEGFTVTFTVDVIKEK